MKPQSAFRTLAGVAVLAFLLAAGSRMAAAAEVQDSEEISQLLSDAKTYAFHVAQDADTLESYTRSNTSWQSHSARLAKMADDVNTLGRINKQLQDQRAQGSPWQQDAITHINSLLTDMASQLSATIDNLKKNQSKIHFPEYQEYVHACYDRASRTSQIVSDYVEYGKAKSTVETLEQKLELSSARAGEAGE